MTGVFLDKLLLFGDSITAGVCNPANEEFNFFGALQHHYMRKLDVVLRGFGGYNSDHGNYILRRILDSECTNKGTVRLMTIFFGTNDSAANWQHVSIRTYQQNLREMINTALEYDIKVILIGPGPHDEINYPQNVPTIDPDTRLNSRNLEYSNAAKAIAEEFRIPFIDLFHVMMESIGWKDGDSISVTDNTKLPHLLPDTIHFSGMAYEILFEQLLKAIEFGYPELATENLPYLLPHHSELEQNGNPLYMLD